MLGDQLKKVRVGKHITQRKLSAGIGVSAQTYNRWEKGYNEPDIKSIIKIAKFYDVSLDYLLGNSDLKNASKLLGAFQSLDSSDREFVNNLIKRLSKK